MGICYEVFILDEFDWNYVGWDKNKTIEQMESFFPHAELKGNSSGMLIFDIDKTWPGELIGKIKMDAMSYRGDNASLTIEAFNINR